MTASKTTDVDLVASQVKHAAQLIGRYHKSFDAVVPSHISTNAFVELALSYVKADTNLLVAAQANPQSLILALRQCAALGHLPIKGVYSLTAFRSKNAEGGWSIVGMEEWRGVVERIFRAGGVESVHVEVGREKDRISFNRVRDPLPRHEYDEFASPEERGPLKVVYAWARLRGGGISQVAWLPRYEVMRHRSMSRSATANESGGNFWGPENGEGPNTEAMWKKTALHVLEGFVPTSAEYRMQVAASEAGSRGWHEMPDRPANTPFAGEYVDGELVADVPVTTPAESDATGWPEPSKPGQGVPDGLK